MAPAPSAFRGIASIEQSTFIGNSAPRAGAIEIYGNSTFEIDGKHLPLHVHQQCGHARRGGAIGIERLNPGSIVRIMNDTFTATLQFVMFTGPAAA